MKEGADLLCSDLYRRTVALVVLNTSRNHQIVNSFGAFVLGNVHMEVANFYVHLMAQVSFAPKHSIEKERLFKYFRGGKSFCRKLCSGQSPVYPSKMW